MGTRDRRGGYEGGGDTLDNKENAVSKASTLSEGRGDLRASERRGEIRELIRGWEGLRVLQVIDQNIIEDEGEMSEIKIKGGKWKRRYGTMSKNGLVEDAGETRLAGTKKLIMGKRGFKLIDEADCIDEEAQFEKKLKVCSNDMIICLELVEKANHNWLQMDQ